MLGLLGLQNGKMSEVDKLKKEIEFFSVLIQRHKKQHKNMATGVTSLSKYKWSKNTRPARSGVSNATPTQETFYKEPISRSRKRPFPPAPEHSSVSRAKFSEHPAKKPVTFDPKFKWSKSKESAPSAVSYHQSSSRQPSPNVPVFSTSSSPTAKQTVVTSTARNSKYKYHKNALPSTSPPAAVSHNVIRKVHPTKYSTSNIRKYKNKSSISSVYNFKSKRSLSPKVVSLFRNNNPYKIRRGQQQILSPHGKKIAVKSPVIRNAKKMSPLERRRRSADSSTHITLSKVALEKLLNKHSVTLKQTLANKAVVKSHETSRTKRRSLDKDRQHCLYYGRFGKCMRGDSCKFIHDPAKVALCTRFLRGTCRDANCSFSHRVEKEKVPLCLFFIRGQCTVPNCPYLHVFLGKDAPICKRFASTGFCPNADKCKEQHVKCCPEFYENGKCRKGKSCKLPHFRMKKPNVKKARSVDESGSGDVTISPGPSTKVTSSKAASQEDEGFLSLEVDAPAKINVPIRRGPTLIKPRFGKLKVKDAQSR